VGILSGLLRGVGSALASRFGRSTRHCYARLRWGRDLPALAAYFGTDKWGAHWYAQHYQRHFAALRCRPLRLLEIGIGGYGDPRAGGESLRMWKAYFPRAQIFGLDIADKRAHDEPRIRTLIGSQDDEERLKQISAEHGPFDIVIDDGSHINAHVLASFRVLFPLLTENGIYAVEDTQTAYWSQFGGAPPGEPAAPTSMNVLRGLVDGLNHREFPRGAEFAPSYLERHIVALHFYHNLVFVQKGVNDELSNILDAQQ
jgi:cephalosporin hydroxylase